MKKFYRITAVILIFFTTIMLIGCKPKEEKIARLDVTPPTKLVYEIGDEFDPNGLKVMVIYVNNVIKLLEETEYELTGFSSEVAGIVTLTVEYRNVTETFDVHISSDELPDQTINNVTYKGVTASDDLDTVVPLNNTDNSTRTRLLSATRLLSFNRMANSTESTSSLIFDVDDVESDEIDELDIDGIKALTPEEYERIISSDSDKFYLVIDLDNPRANLIFEIIINGQKYARFADGSDLYRRVIIEMDIPTDLKSANYTVESITVMDNDDDKKIKSVDLTTANQTITTIFKDNEIVSFNVNEIYIGAISLVFSIDVDVSKYEGFEEENTTFFAVLWLDGVVDYEELTAGNNEVIFTNLDWNTGYGLNIVTDDPLLIKGIDPKGVLYQQTYRTNSPIEISLDTSYNGYSDLKLTINEELNNIDYNWRIVKISDVDGNSDWNKASESALPLSIETFEPDTEYHIEVKFDDYDEIVVKYFKTYPYPKFNYTEGISLIYDFDNNVIEFKINDVIGKETINRIYIRTAYIFNKDERVVLPSEDQMIQINNNNPINIEYTIYEIGGSSISTPIFDFDFMNIMSGFGGLDDEGTWEILFPDDEYDHTNRGNLEVQYIIEYDIKIGNENVIEMINFNDILTDPDQGHIKNIIHLFELLVKSQEQELN